MHKILIIEDDKAIARLEKDFLEINDFTVTIQYDGKDGSVAKFENQTRPL